MPEAVDLHKRWHHLRVDAEGITIGWWHRRDHIPWSEVGALAVDSPLSLLEVAATRGVDWGYLRNPCLYVCVMHDGRPRPAMAMRFPSRGLRMAPKIDREIAQLHALLGGWIDLHQVQCRAGLDVEVWWYAQPGARPVTTEVPTSEPTVAEKAARIHHDIEEMRTERERLRDEQ